MSLDSEINAYFLRTQCADAGKDVNRSIITQDMALCLYHVQQVISPKRIHHVKAKECLALISARKLTKCDVFILDIFEGDCFTELQHTNAVILGPRSVISCLQKDEPIPLGNHPLYTVAMCDMQISASGVNRKEKERLRQLIQWMGGYYFNNLGRQVTHLISNTIRSVKYEQATLHGIPVFHVDWVQQVWQRSCVDNVLASDKEFGKYRLPIFYDTNITCTGLGSVQKEEIKRLVNENGGTYHPAFRANLVDIVITTRDATSTDKYQVALQYNKDILTSEWIYDSVRKGFALPISRYQLNASRASTSNNSQRSSENITCSDSTQVSNLSHKSVISSKTINETLNFGLATSPEEVTKENAGNSTSREAQVILPGKKDLQCRQKCNSMLEATQLFDAFSPSMNGFKQPELRAKDKLIKDAVESEFPFIKPLATSAKLAMEDGDWFIVTKNKVNNPTMEMPVESLSADALLKPSKDTCSTTIAATQKPPLPSANSMTKNPINPPLSNKNFFHGMSLYVHKKCFTEDILLQVLSSCKEAHGNVVSTNFPRAVDYAIVSFERSCDVSSLPIKARNIVTELFIEDCISHKKLVSIEYFHKPIPNTADVQPLRGMTVVISTYTLLERDFIESLARLLGATFNDDYVRKEQPLLVCQTTEGSKYKAALKWNYPVVFSSWMVDCAQEGKKLSYDNYLVGNCARDFECSSNYANISSGLKSDTGTNNSINTNGQNITSTQPMNFELKNEASNPASNQSQNIYFYKAFEEFCKSQQKCKKSLKRQLNILESDSDQQQLCTTPAAKKQTMHAEISCPERNCSDGATQISSDLFDFNTQTSNVMGQMSAPLGKSNLEDNYCDFKSSTPFVEGKNSPLQQITEYLKKYKTQREGFQRNQQTTDAPRAVSSELFETEENEEATEGMVGWRDPADLSMKRLVRGSKMQYQGTPLFSISCSDERTRCDIIKKICKLGGKVCANLTNYDPACTHFLCERPNRGEKILGCISAGKWVLSLQYIEESFAKDTFVDEELFEWGNSKAINLRQLNSDEQVIALAAFRWRKLLATKGKYAGAFAGFRTILRLPEKNIEPMKNVIRAGQGEVIEAQSPYSQKNGAHWANYCFVDSRHAPLTPEDYHFLRNAGVKVYTQLFINGYLMNCGDLEPTKYEINMI